MKKEENKRAVNDQNLDQVSGGVARNRRYPSTFELEFQNKLNDKAREIYEKSFNELTEEEKKVVVDLVTGTRLHTAYACPHAERILGPIDLQNGNNNQK